MAPKLVPQTVHGPLNPPMKITHNNQPPYNWKTSVSTVNIHALFYSLLLYNWWITNLNSFKTLQ